jgi:hypothetical protein
VRGCSTWLFFYQRCWCCACLVHPCVLYDPGYSQVISQENGRCGVHMECGCWVC